MNKLASAIAATSLILSSTLFSTLTHAGALFTFDVSITNVTAGQVITPPVVMAHNRHYTAFTLGQPASDALTALAEDGNFEPLAEEGQQNNYIGNIEFADGPVLPGKTRTIQIESSFKYPQLSVMAMLASSNDAFLAANNIRLSLGKKPIVIEAKAYDAGSEANSEKCEFIPGPPCGNAHVRDTDNAEGYVHIHNGIHGKADLAPGTYTWNGPVAIISVKRVGK